MIFLNIQLIRTQQSASARDIYKNTPKISLHLVCFLSFSIRFKLCLNVEKTTAIHWMYFKECTTWYGENFCRISIRLFILYSCINSVQFDVFQGKNRFLCVVKINNSLD